MVISHFGWRRQWHPTPVLLPGKSHGWRSLVGYSPWGREELGTTERLHFHFSLSCIGEGNGNPLQCSCLDNPRDAGAWWAAVYGVAQSQTRLKQLSSSSSSKPLWLDGVIPAQSDQPMDATSYTPGDKRMALRDHLENLSGTPAVSLEISKCQEADCSSLQNRGESYSLGSNLLPEFIELRNDKGLTRI